jgi:UDP-glucuronate 4-epimerase
MKFLINDSLEMPGHPTGSVLIRKIIRRCPYNSSPVTLLEYIESLENALNKKAIKEFIEMQPGDVPGTHADTESLQSYINFKPNTSIDTGILNFVNWYKEWYLI